MKRSGARKATRRLGAKSREIFKRVERRLRGRGGGRRGVGRTEEGKGCSVVLRRREKEVEVKMRVKTICDGV